MVDLEPHKTPTPPFRLESLIAEVKVAGHEPTFSRLLAACGDPRRAAQARFLHREIIGDVETRAEMDELPPWDEC